MPALVFPDIDPVALAIGPFAIRWYAIAYIAGIFFGWWYARRLVSDPRLWGERGSPITAADIDDFVVWATVGVIVGGRLGYVLFYDLQRYAAAPLEIFAVWQGGMSFHGGFVGTIVAMIAFARSRGFAPLSLLDVVGPSVTVGLFLGRLANFVNGELFGRVADVPWAVVFPLGGPEARHPSQLYEAALEGLLLFALLRLITHRFHKLATPGFVAGAFAGGYGVARTLVEFFREPDIQIGYLAGGLTMGMALSVPMIVVGAALIVYAMRTQPVSDAAPTT